MYLLGHAGLTIAAVRAADRDAGLRLPALLAVVPDLIDKPVAWLLPAFANHNTRGIGHTFLAAFLTLAALLAWGRRIRRPLRLWCCCCLGHFILDRMWEFDNPAILLWPLMGPFPPPMPGGHIKALLFRYNVLGEAVGLAVLLNIFARHGLFEAARLRAFMKTGRLPQEGA